MVQDGTEICIELFVHVSRAMWAFFRDKLTTIASEYIEIFQTDNSYINMLKATMTIQDYDLKKFQNNS